MDDSTFCGSSEVQQKSFHWSKKTKNRYTEERKKNSFNLLMSCGTAQYQERSSQLKISFKGGSESRVSAWLLQLRETLRTCSCPNQNTGRDQHG